MKKLRRVESSAVAPMTTQRICQADISVHQGVNICNAFTSYGNNIASLLESSNHQKFICCVSSSQHFQIGNHSSKVIKILKSKLGLLFLALGIKGSWLLDKSSNKISECLSFHN